METRVVRLIHNNLYAVLEEVKPSHRSGYEGDARTYVVEIDKVDSQLLEEYLEAINSQSH